MTSLYGIIYLLTQVLTFAIFIRAILSWFPIDTNNPLANILFQVTEPVLAPMRRIVPRIGMIDITPMVAIIVLQIVGNVVGRMS
ncbi:MAG: YggT family protein [Chloroflexi bacterium]|nr:YggT family protein [Chloroflexota bacterium]